MSRPFANLTRVWALIDRFGDLTAIPESKSVHLFSLQVGFFDSVYKGAFNLLRVWWKDTPSLYMNGMGYLQLRLPFFIGVQLRLPYVQHYFQCGFGWKGNGRFAMGFYWLIFWPALIYLFGWHWCYLFFLMMIRFQTDASSAAGMDGANTGQALGLNDGNK